MLLKDYIESMKRKDMPGVTHYEREDYIIKSFIRENSQGTRLLDDIIRKTEENLGKTLKFEATATNLVGYAKEYEKAIYVTVSDCNTLDNVLGILIHELGETDYLARKLPIVGSNIHEDTFYNKIVELFSHPHCRRLASEYSLAEVEGTYRVNAVERCIFNHNNPENYSTGWEKLIGLAHYLCTYPELHQHRQRLDLYTEFNVVVDNIIHIVEDTNTYGEPEVVECSMNQVIEQLKSIENESYRLPSYVIMKKRNF